MSLSNDEYLNILNKDINDLSAKELEDVILFIGKELTHLHKKHELYIEELKSRKYKEIL